MEQMLKMIGNVKIMKYLDIRKEKHYKKINLQLEEVKEVNKPIILNFLKKYRR